MDFWVLIRFVHVLGAALWVGGQLAFTLVVMPGLRAAAPERPKLAAALGRRFARVTLIGALPLQIASGVALAIHNGVTWSLLGEPGYGRTLAAKLLLLTIAMAAAAAHGIAAAKGRHRLSRALGITGLVCSMGVILLATALVG